MASSNVMASTSNSRNSNLALSSLPTSHPHHHLHHPPHHPPPSSSSSMIPDFTPNSARNNDLPSPMILRNVYGDNPTENTLLDAEITLIDAAGAISAIDFGGAPEPSIRRQNSGGGAPTRKTVDDVWREIVSERKECKMESPDEMMTLEDFLAKAGAEVDEEEVEDSKAAPPPLMAMGTTERLSGCGSGGLFGFDPLVQSPYPLPPPQPGMGEVGVMGFGNGDGVEVVGGRGKRRGAPILEPLGKAAQQRQRRMIKNRESAARSRERKQAYQVELESLAVKLEEENEKLLREKAEWTKQRYKQLMEKVVPVVEKRKPLRVLRRVRSTQW